MSQRNYTDLGHVDLLSRLSIEMNTIWALIIEKVKPNIFFFFFFFKENYFKKHQNKLMPLDFTIQIQLVMLLGLIDVILNTLFDQQSNFKMISQVESFLYPDKQGGPEEGQKIQCPKCCVSTNNNKDEEQQPEKSQNIAHQASSKKFRYIAIFKII